MDAQVTQAGLDFWKRASAMMCSPSQEVGESRATAQIRRRSEKEGKNAPKTIFFPFSGVRGISTVDFRPTRSLTADYARLSRFLLNNAPGSEMSYFAAATHMDEKLPFEQITLAQLLPADKHSLWQS